jgi:hypothetical protein
MYKPELPTGHFFGFGLACHLDWPSLTYCAGPAEKSKSVFAAWPGLQDRSGQLMFLIFQIH